MQWWGSRKFSVSGFKPHRWGETPSSLAIGIGIGIEAGWGLIPMAIPTLTSMKGARPTPSHLCDF